MKKLNKKELEVLASVLKNYEYQEDASDQIVDHEYALDQIVEIIGLDQISEFWSIKNIEKLSDYCERFADNEFNYLNLGSCSDARDSAKRFVSYLPILFPELA